MTSSDAHTLALFTIDGDSESPPFRQLQDEVIRSINDGKLLPGQRLPTVRALAAHLGVATNTVASAYRALESTGVLVGRGRSGTFVSFGENPVEEAARALAAKAAEEVVKLGLSQADALEIFGDAVTVAVREHAASH